MIRSFTAPGSRLDAEAADWLLRHDDGLSEADAMHFQGWLARTPAHMAAWENAFAVWAAFDDRPLPAETDELLQAARADRPGLHGAKSWWAIAAVLALTAGLGFTTLRQEGDPQIAGDVARAEPSERFRTAEAARSVTLPDGSVVEMDARSDLAVSSRNGARSAVLYAGRAVFHVRHDPSRPLVVDAGGRRITDVGTVFGIALEGGSMSVSLLEGKVMIASGFDARTVTLSPGQRYLAKGSAPGSVSNVNVRKELAWNEGYVVFDAVSVREAVLAMNRYAKKPLVVGDARTGSYRVSGRFRIDETTSFVDTLTALHPIRAETKADGTIVLQSRRGPRP